MLFMAYGNIFDLIPLNKIESIAMAVQKCKKWVEIIDFFCEKC